MSIAIITLSIVLILIGIAVVVAVLLQQGKAHGLSGAIAGGAETFFGKEKADKMNRNVSRWTTIGSIVFVLIVLVLFILSPDLKFTTNHSADVWSISPYNSTAVTEMIGEDK